MSELKVLGVICFIIYLCWLFSDKLTNKRSKIATVRNTTTHNNNANSAPKDKAQIKNDIVVEKKQSISDDPESPFYITKQQHRLNIMRAESILEKEVRRRISEQQKLKPPKRPLPLSALSKRYFDQRIKNIR